MPLRAELLLSNQNRPLPHQRRQYPLSCQQVRHQQVRPRRLPRQPLEIKLTEVCGFDGIGAVAAAILPHFAQFWCNLSPFRINTYRNARKC
jgi:hypothetical protein